MFAFECLVSNLFHVHRTRGVEVGVLLAFPGALADAHLVDVVHEVVGNFFVLVDFVLVRIGSDHVVEVRHVNAHVVVRQVQLIDWGTWHVVELVHEGLWEPLLLHDVLSILILGF